MHVIMNLKRMLRSKGLRTIGVTALVLTTCYCLLHQYELRLRQGQFLHVQNITTTHVSDNERRQCILSKTKPAFSICPYSKSEDIFISAALKSDGVWERHMTDLFVNILQREKTLTLVDIGANIGYFSLLSSTMGIPVVAVEPIEENVHRLSNAIILNKLQKNITVLKNAVSNQRGILTMSLSENNRGGHRVLRHHEKKDGDKHSVAQVTSVTMNDLIPLIHTPDVLLKVDVEGLECLVLEAAEEFFNTFNVKHIIMEWSKMTFIRHIYGVPCSPIDIVTMTERLVRRDYRAYDVIQNRPIDVQESDKWTYGDVHWVKL